MNIQEKEQPRNFERAYGVYTVVEFLEELRESFRKKGALGNFGLLSAVFASQFDGPTQMTTTELDAQARQSGDTNTNVRIKYGVPGNTDNINTPDQDLLQAWITRNQEVESTQTETAGSREIDSFSFRASDLLALFPDENISEQIQAGQSITLNIRYEDGELSIDGNALPNSGIADTINTVLEQIPNLSELENQNIVVTFIIDDTVEANSTVIRAEARMLVSIQETGTVTFGEQTIATVTPVLYFKNADGGMSTTSGNPVAAENAVALTVFATENGLTYIQYKIEDETILAEFTDDELVTYSQVEVVNETGGTINIRTGPGTSFDLRDPLIHGEVIPAINWNNPIDAADLQEFIDANPSIELTFNSDGSVTFGQGSEKWVAVRDGDHLAFIAEVFNGNGFATIRFTILETLAGLTFSSEEDTESEQVNEEPVVEPAPTPPTNNQTEVTEGPTPPPTESTVNTTFNEEEWFSTPLGETEILPTAAPEGSWATAEVGYARPDFIFQATQVSPLQTEAFEIPNGRGGVIKIYNWFYASWFDSSGKEQVVIIPTTLAFPEEWDYRGEIQHTMFYAHGSNPRTHRDVFNPEVIDVITGAALYGFDQTALSEMTPEERNELNMGSGRRLEIYMGTYDSTLQGIVTRIGFEPFQGYVIPQDNINALKATGDLGTIDHLLPEYQGTPILTLVDYNMIDN